MLAALTMPAATALTTPTLLGAANRVAPPKMAVDLEALAKTQNPVHDAAIVPSVECCADVTGSRSRLARR